MPGTVSVFHIHIVTETGGATNSIASKPQYRFSTWHMPREAKHQVILFAPFQKLTRVFWQGPGIGEVFVQVPLSLGAYVGDLSAHLR